MLWEKWVHVDLHALHTLAHPDSSSPQPFEHDGITNQDQTTPEKSGGMIPISTLSQYVESEIFVCLDRSSPNFEFQGMGSSQATCPTPSIFGVNDNCVPSIGILLHCSHQTYKSVLQKWAMHVSDIFNCIYFRLTYFLFVVVAFLICRQHNVMCCNKCITYTVHETWNPTSFFISHS